MERLKYLSSLNPEQRRAVEHGASGPGPLGRGAECGAERAL
jgi:hypothetical protein